MKKKGREGEIGKRRVNKKATGRKERGPWTERGKEGKEEQRQKNGNGRGSVRRVLSRRMTILQETHTVMSPVLYTRSTSQQTQGRKPTAQRKE